MANGKKYTKVNFKKLIIDFIYEDKKGTNDIGNFNLSKKNDGYTVAFLFTNEETGEQLKGSVFVQNENEYLDKFFQEFKEHKKFINVEALAKTNDDNDTIYSLNLGYSKPIVGMTINQMKEKIKYKK